MHPEILRAVAAVSDQLNGTDKSRVISAAVDVMERNLNGLVVNDYNVDTDTMDWVFGTLRFPRLYQAPSGRRWPDDPFIDRREDIPLVEFMTYLDQWYWPKRREITSGVPMANDPGVHLIAAREVSA